MDGSFDATQRWFDTSLGARYLDEEAELVAQALDTVFGEQLVQIGIWGPRETFLRSARTQRRTLVDWRLDAEADVVCAPGRIAIASDSIDAVLLPHTLEMAPSPHALLREAGRILRADGHLIALSFAPHGAWGLRHLLDGAGYPPGRQRMIRERQLRDWLELLSFAVGPALRYCHALPLERLKHAGRRHEESLIVRWLPLLSGGYLLAAQKRVHPLTPVRPLWRQKRLRVVGGLVKPTTRGSQSRTRS